MTEYEEKERKTSLAALRRFVKHCGPTRFTFITRIPLSRNTNQVNGTLLLENGDLTVCAQDMKANIADIREDIVSFSVPQRQDFIRAFEEAKNMLKNELAALQEHKSILMEQYEMACAQF
ncbi:hypothetical protein, unlikely [Trypanosoma brucei gambiense DAL972]|uniref:Uncharacterized protein n=1 Tax=Trypanosoma brucei gambiense (strain MHOM/CI/86/DAL972) TaxID=679716 RepID=D0A903_TRYB9|nr:hypothetical protein, unlikely [Trypanosoma brucei gambiense DAL972]CBH18154.1 hypothetical protein, unlikely [Trypanosoma brucei gambiense DAL972]|eukprot:XP_011780418.1 hypothetical protein, unlikely [Trypanosoma brucei gambiense DAL972]